LSTEEPTNGERDDGGSLVITPSYVGPNRRDYEHRIPYSGPERRSDSVSNVAFSRAVHSATLASTREITKIYMRRLAWPLIAIVCAISAAIALPVALGSDAAKKEAVKRNCDLVIRTTNSMSMFFSSEMALRKKMMQNPRVPQWQKQLDRSVLNEWNNTTRPALRRVLRSDCTGSGAIPLR
jgi:hypothetical protein